MTSTTKEKPFAYAGYPRGWFVIQFSEELAPGAVKPLEYFGKKLVLFRSESGVPTILDAFCPHQGAHRMSIPRQSPGEPASHFSGRAGQQNVHAMHDIRRAAH